MIEIIPAIIPKNLEDLEEKMSSVRKLVPLVQVDVLDGSLVPARSWPYQSSSKPDTFFEHIVKEQEGFPFWQELEFEAHLMVREPERIISDWIAAGATRIIVQLEGVSDFQKLFDVVDGKVPLGVALALDTPIEKLTPIVEKIEAIQCMGWNFKELGHQGRPFDERTFDTIRRLRELYPTVILSVDGGVNLENAPKLIEAGVSRLVVGSAIFASDNPTETIKTFQNL
ncbi:MAG: hypothetical protein A2836_01005 [Candidatus Taylorbacteria bacterium RIFCSPHIGHO2_01_FULL_45_63]|uniref:Ribulose-phosphate 3-epimerase n=1 Tax=Candidatus Taylorbacteria bacterium RIFCSPHIGHO2_02_FULL_45_35 TaxID=1802311 RepID=A0A1G2MPT6_9BACT|nr:MAG: hypothetical protein A2836_01005 [Candidatus Taylorbacteria bacterium RIFCSPHIGHO2_01_FULL_45_63]OHA25876.1 MAG: hypothetical protein A3D56_01775 [Candidatus Taylorbacteria bacterium RIFCSPHIGHO2_02_FULL_45_35]OHA32366.1 MAG: hypothetical protein A3A22_03605 [Candidatus Taylorbacteria bacterium RIFCSPLOWO2_01_FULL_45_34b]